MSLQASRTALGILALLPLAGAAAWWIGGPTGTGLALGYLLGAGFGLVGTFWQLHWARLDATRVFRAQTEVFLVKLAAVVVFALVFRYVADVATRVDWRGFLVGYAFALLLALPLGAWDAAKSIQKRSAS